MTIACLVMLRAVALVLASIVGLAACPALAAAAGATDALRVKDLGRLQGWRDNALIGTGLVTGLAGTGDSPGNRASRQALSNLLSRFDLGVAPEQVQSRNVAVVTVSAALPSVAREGDRLDLTVSSVGDARSLVGGSLLLTPLRGADGRVHALAQGALSVGGYRYDANGNVVQKNHPTTASVPNGAVVERAMPLAGDDDAPTRATLVLTEPDYTTVSRVAAAINRELGQPVARAVDAAGIDIELPGLRRDERVALFTRIENVRVTPDRRARVVINERTGTVVSGSDVRISAVAISHGGIRIAIETRQEVSQPVQVIGGGEGIRTAVVGQTRVEVDELGGTGFVEGSGTVGDLVQSLARLKTSTRDVISILRAVKAAGALHGELVVQ